MKAAKRQKKRRKYVKGVKKRRTKRIVGRQEEWTKRTGARWGGKVARKGVRQRGRKAIKAGRPQRGGFRDRALPFKPQSEEMVEDYGFEAPAGGGEMFQDDYFEEEGDVGIMDEMWFWPAVVIGGGSLIYFMTKKKKG